MHVLRNSLHGKKKISKEKKAVHCTDFENNQKPETVFWA